MTTYCPRTPWPEHFPDVIVHQTLSARNNHPAYAAAKAGDSDAALKLVLDLLPDDGIENVRNLIGDRQPLLVPVAAIEAFGFNAIPDAMAQLLSVRLGFAMAPYDLKQSNYVAHTKANGWHRLVTPAEFTGTITTGKDYFLIDDHVGFGGTLANLRGYIETKGGQVIGMTTLSETRGGRTIAIRPETQNMLQRKHGNDLNTFWNSVFGYGVICLTNIEAGYLSRVESIDAVRTHMAGAAEAARSKGVQSIFPHQIVDQ
jgi:hypothetical protein